MAEGNSVPNPDTANLLENPILEIVSPTPEINRPSRIRNLTDLGLEQYRLLRLEHNNKLDIAWSQVEGNLAVASSYPKELETLQDAQKKLHSSVDVYQQYANRYTEFLARTNTLDSHNELVTFTQITSARHLAVRNCSSVLATQIQEALELKSHRSVFSEASRRSRQSGSRISTHSLHLADRRAKASAARASAEFAVKEVELLKKKAELDAAINLLQHQKEVAVAEAEVTALELDYSESQDHRSSISLPQSEPDTRTKEYVDKHRLDACLSAANPDNPAISPLLATEPRKEINKTHQLGTVRDTKPSLQRLHTSLNPDAKAYIPAVIPGIHENSQALLPTPEACITTELTRFLLKKELLLTRLSTFDDRPQSYAVWKTGFRNIMKELGVTACEELDLLVKFLGPESARYAMNLRAASAREPTKGLACIWDRLDERYGAPELIEASLKNRLASFPRLSNKDNKKLYELSDLLSEVASLKEDRMYQAILGYFDSSAGVNPIVSKLPYGLQEMWTRRAVKYKAAHGSVFPPFSLFVDFVQEVSKVKNDPSFNFETICGFRPGKTTEKYPRRNDIVSSKRTNVTHIDNTIDKSREVNRCPLHKADHTLNQCRGFRSKTLEERRDLLKRYKFCFRCCASSKHFSKACKKELCCDECGSTKHPSALHVSGKFSCKSEPASSEANVGGEIIGNKNRKEESVLNKCTQICGGHFRGKSCSKTVLVKVYPAGQPGKAKEVYCIVDDQSNASLARSNLFDMLEIISPDIPYTLASCSGYQRMSGRRAHGVVVESLDSATKIDIPTLVECDLIPNVREEIPTSEVAKWYPHLRDISRHIPSLNSEAEIVLLIGRDVIGAHYVLDQRIGPRNSPYAQKLPLGWVIIGETCLGKVHDPGVVKVNKTYILNDGRSTIMKPCSNQFQVKLTNRSTVEDEIGLGSSVFRKTIDDDKVGLSIDDIEFLSIMDREFFRDKDGSWVAPLPFRGDEHRSLPNNRTLAWKRAQILTRSMNINEAKKRHLVTFMGKLLDSGHAEPAPTLKVNASCWYLPLFGVYHPKKPDAIRGVFDSSAQYNGVSLNNKLLSGPDLTNNLVGVLLRFRREAVAVIADIEQMFYCFRVREDHRDYLRFLWHEDNDLEKELVDYRMCVHVFGNAPSPAVANYGLRTIARASEKKYGEEVRNFICRNFYVDDGLVSLPTAEEAIELIKKTQEALWSGGNVRLHKIASNSPQVMKAFSPDDQAKDLRDLDFNRDVLPLTYSLGLAWDLKLDAFTFQVSQKDKPYTRRGVLSTVNSLFDPLGFVAPVTVCGKLILRKITSEVFDWDEPLSSDFQKEWDDWRTSLRYLENVHIPRTYVRGSLVDASRKELHIFSDASEQAIAVAAYLKTKNKDGKIQVGFVLGKAKVAPKHGHTIPRLELCAAVLAVEVGAFIQEHLDLKLDSVNYYTDSKIVLGYINNRSRRFFVYVANRVDLIRKASNPEQWRYVNTVCNPADAATRSSPGKRVDHSTWILGPDLLYEDQEVLKEMYPLIQPEKDNEVRSQTVQTLKTDLHRGDTLGSQRFERFSSWRRLVQTVSRLRHIAKTFRKETPCSGWHICSDVSCSVYEEVEKHLIKQMQHEVYEREVTCLRQGRPLSKNSRLIDLNPEIDEEGLLRVGGRLRRAEIELEMKKPVLISGTNHIATLLVRHHHEAVQHQGRHLTEGAVRAAGLWIVGGKRLISSLIRKCVICRRLRAKPEHQKMADLPKDRLTPAPPFTYVGLDTFGPWSIVARRTRGGVANAKRWAILFTCLTTRAIHIEVIEEMSSSSFINALRRFIAVRGNVKQIRSDRGTNFVGAAHDLAINTINVEDPVVKSFLHTKGTEWVFNPPHSSHMGGVWERMIGITRRILESLILGTSAKGLTHEVLTTFMAEVTAIVNARPLVPVSSDPDSPFLLSPSTLLTQKTDHTFISLDSHIGEPLYKAQWKRVQALSDTFWSRWKKEYLHTLQRRRKWHEEIPNVNDGDIVLLKDRTLARNEWPFGQILRAIPSADKKIRKAVVRVVKGGTASEFTRPVTEMVLLVSKNQCVV